MKGVLKQGTPRCLRRRKDCSTSLPSEAGSILQKLPFPGSSCDRGTLTKYRFSDKLCRIEFCKSWKKWISLNDVIPFPKFLETGKGNINIAHIYANQTLLKSKWQDGSSLWQLVKQTHKKSLNQNYEKMT